MRQLARWVVVLVVLASTTTLARTAAAQLTPCAPGNEAATLVAPKAVAFGRTDNFHLHNTPNDRYYDTEGQYAAVSPVRGGVFANSYVAPAKRNWPIQPLTGDGDALITVTYQEYSQPDDARVDYCQRTLQTVVKIGKGKSASVNARKYQYGETLRGSLQASKECANTNANPLTLNLHGGGINKTFHLSDVCGGNWKEPTFRKNGMKVVLKNSAGGNGRPEYDVSALYLPTNRTNRYTVTLRQGSAVIKRSLIKVRWINNEGREIYEGTDAFVNVCINGNHKIYSRHLRLYCVVGAYEARKLRVLR
jgi:hypothetical protein